MLPTNDYYFPLQTGGSSKEEQEKSITITSNGVNIVTPDAGKSLSKVSITTNVPQSGVPEKGVIFSDYDSEGYPHTATIKDMFEIVQINAAGDTVALVKQGMFGTNSNGANSGNAYLSKLEKIVLNSTTTIRGFNNYCFESLSSLKEITYTNAYPTSIIYGNFSFMNTGFESLTLRNVKEINTYSFLDCKKLKTVNFINYISNILGGFCQCDNLMNIELPNNITKISSWSFYNCFSLINLTIPENVTNIGNSALQIGLSTNKATITFKSTTPPTITTSTFDETKLNKIYVPSASVEAYKTADKWTSLAAYIEADPNE